MLGGGALAAGAILALDAQGIDQELRDRYPSLEIPANSRDAQQLDDARLKGGVALGLYIGGAVVAALGALFVAVHVGQPAPPVAVVASDRGFQVSAQAAL